MQPPSKSALATISEMLRIGVNRIKIPYDVTESISPLCSFDGGRLFRLRKR